MRFLLRLGLSMITLGILTCLGGVLPLTLLVLLAAALPLVVVFGGVLLVLFLFVCAIFFILF